MLDPKIPPSLFVVNGKLRPFGAVRSKKLNNLNKLAGGLGTLRLLFKEILQQIPPEQANELAEGYRRGENIVLIVGESAYGEDKKTAFAWTLTKSQDWRGLELDAVMQGPKQ